MYNCILFIFHGARALPRGKRLNFGAESCESSDKALEAARRHKSKQPTSINLNNMAAPQYVVKGTIERQLTELLERFSDRKTRGMYMRIRNGILTVDTLAYSTNPEWRKFKVRAADRERAFMDWVRPYAESFKTRIRVHPGVWRFVDVMGCIYYDEGGKVEVTCDVHDGNGLDNYLFEERCFYDGTPYSARLQQPTNANIRSWQAQRALTQDGRVLIDLTNA